MKSLVARRAIVSHRRCDTSGDIREMLKSISSLIIKDLNLQIEVDGSLKMICGIKYIRIVLREP